MKGHEVAGLFIFTGILFLFVLWVSSIFFPWRDIIWENKGRVFRIRRVGYYWIVEKKFLCFFIKNDLFGTNRLFTTKASAIKKLSEYLKELDEIQNSECIIDYTNFISDPKRLIGTKKLETKRIDYDKN